MKRLNNLKLYELTADNLSDREMKEIRGGGRQCSCSCRWEGSGGSSTDDNCDANYGTGGSGIGSPIGSGNPKCQIYNT